MDVSDQLLYAHITHIYVSITVRQTKKGGMVEKKYYGPVLFLYMYVYDCVC